MPQIQLSIFPDSSCAITPELAFERRDGVVFYFNGHLPVFSHAVEDIGAFRLFTSQLIKNGSASQSQVARAFGVSLTAVKRACKKLREQGTAGFFLPPVAREGAKPSSARLAEAQAFYPMESIFVLLAFLALARVPSFEQLRYESPGEWGKLLGLDRIPEVKTLREKLGLLGDDAERTARWSSQLAHDWMERDVEAAGVLLIDGHTRVYHGELTPLPRRYVSRERLCLRGATDYWVNALDGAPFFCVTCAIDPGLQKTLEENILPRLLADVLPLFARLEAQRIAILCYHKFPGADWPASEFSAQKITLQNGESVTILLAERGTQLSNQHWVREVRRLDAKAHQTSILSTDYRSELSKQAAAMFARWSQENFFKYMREHYGLDRLVEHARRV